MYLLFISLIFNLTFEDNQWVSYFENDQIEISYKVTTCEYKKYQIIDEYYLIKIKNKTSETLVINFHKGNQTVENDEDKIAFVLKSKEIKEGSCSNSLGLNIFKKKLLGQNKISPVNFNLSNIKIIEVY